MWNFFDEKQLSLFFAVSAANFKRRQKSINDVTHTSDTPSLGYGRVGTDQLPVATKIRTDHR